jgi:hypothetical protein
MTDSTPDLPDTCVDCGNRLLLRRPGRTRCARCHPADEWWASVPPEEAAP